MSRNEELARVLDRIADLMEIDGSDGFRVSSYRRAARTLRDTGEDVELLAAAGRLTELPGIGKGTADRISQYLRTGHVEILDELSAKFPPGLPDLLEIPGMGPKKVALVHAKLGVKSIEDLRKVIESGELEDLPGLGPASVKKIAEGLDFLSTRGGRTPLGVALPIAEGFLERVAELPGVGHVSLAGSLRRGAETIGDIDILCDAKNGEPVVKAFCGLDGVKRVLAAGPTKGSVTVETSEGREVQVDLRVVEAASFGAALLYFTGSKDHNIRLRERAIARGWRLNEYGLFEGEKSLAGKKEEEVYRKLGLPWIPPELREDRGELEHPPDADSLVALADIRGDLHMHTVASDGRSTIEEMAEAAKELGYDYLAICDHSKSATIANGLTVDRMRGHIEAVRAAGRRIKGIEILAGCECDILPDGTMDYPDSLLKECDWVVASIHSAMGAGGSGKLNPTERTIAAMENRYVSAIGHPTGRIINKRAPMELDMSAVFEAAHRTNTFLEINASWQRLDLRDVHARQALLSGVTLVINTDAHSVDQLRLMRYGVLTARRAGAAKRQILNCCAPTAMRKRIARKRA